MDLFSRKIIGYAYGTSMTIELAVKAVENACLNVKTTEGIILHSNLGSCYTSSEFESFLYSKGNPYDNACIESFHSLLKKEEVNHRKYYDFNAARKAIFEYIESRYNRKRIHGSIDYMTPQAAHEAASVRSQEVKLFVTKSLTQIQTLNFKLHYIVFNCIYMQNIA